MTYYLIKSKDRGYKENVTKGYLQVSGFAIYSSDIGTAIHNKLPEYISEKEDDLYTVISSENPEFWDILREEINGEGGVYGLDDQIKDLEERLSIKKKNRDLIKKVLEKQK